MTETQDQAAQAATMVKIKTLRECVIGGKIVPVGQIVMATPEEAAEYCDKGFEGFMPFYGNKPEIGMLDGGADPLARKSIYRAVRVQQ